MPVETDQLATAARALKYAAGIQWNEFLTALKVAEHEAAMMLVRAPQEKLSMAQGRAQAIRDLRDSLEKATTEKN
jgi:arginyl-tRNA synthetase